MELRQLQYFVAVAEELHFGRAAGRLHIGQSTVSEQVRKLERELKLHLFDRSSRTVRLSPAGERMLARAQDVLAAADAMMTEARSAADSTADVLHFGTGSSLGNRLDLFLDLLLVHGPAFRLRFRHLPAAERLEQVRAGNLDAAVMRGTAMLPGLRRLPLWDDRLIAVLPASHPQARLERTSLAALKGMPLRISPHEVNPVLHDTLMTACAEAGFRPMLGRPFSNRHDTLAEIALERDSWTVLYQSNAEGIPRRLVCREFADVAPAIPVALVVRADLQPSRLGPLEATCLDLFKQVQGS